MSELKSVLLKEKDHEGKHEHLQEHNRGYLHVVCSGHLAESIKDGVTKLLGLEGELMLIILCKNLSHAPRSVIKQM